MIVVTDEDVQRHVSFAAVLEAVERAFVALEGGGSRLFDVVLGTGGADNYFFAIKSGRDASIPMLGLKSGSYNPQNESLGLAAHSSTTLLVDDLTGRAVAVVEANYLNGMRTSAANALAARALARADAATLGIIGTGAQAVFEALAIAHVRPIRRIIAAGRSAERRKRFEAGIRDKLDVEVRFATPEVCAREADVLVTVTPSRDPVVESAWVRRGTYVGAMGADDVGKQELPLELIDRAACWVDHPEQAARIGEMQHAVSARMLSVEQLRARTLGGLLRSPASSAHDAEVTVFDSSGVAVQDIAAAHAALVCVQAVHQAPLSAGP